MLDSLPLKRCLESLFELFFPQTVEIDEPELVRVVRKEQDIPKGSYSDLHVYEVTCLEVGTTKITFVVGNNPSATNR